MQLPEDIRKSALAKIHIAKNQLGLEEETYRDLLEQLTGKRSAAKLNAIELNQVLEFFRKSGFKTKLSPRTKDKKIKEPKDKVRALWITLYQEGKVKDRSEAGLNKFIKRQTGVERIDWLLPKQAAAVIEALKIIQEKP